MAVREKTRRDFLKSCIDILSGIPLIAGIAACGKKSNGTDDTGGPADLKIDITEPDYAVLATAGGAVYVTVPGSAKPVILYRKNATEVTAVSSECTHAGCQVNLPVNGVIGCPCHGSTFDQDGRVTGGPASADLKSHTASLNGNTISINLT